MGLRDRARAAYEAATTERAAEAAAADAALRARVHEHLASGLHSWAVAMDVPPPAYDVVEDGPRTVRGETAYDHMWEVVALFECDGVRFRAAASKVDREGRAPAFAVYVVDRRGRAVGHAGTPAELGATLARRGRR